MFNTNNALNICTSTFYKVIDNLGANNIQIRNDQNIWQTGNRTIILSL